MFAIAITLLVLTIAQPSNDYDTSAASLPDRWPALAAYVVSFAVIGIMWLNHHSIFSHLERIDRGLVSTSTSCCLLTIVFHPLPDRGLRRGAAPGTRRLGAAVIVYSATMTVNALRGQRALAVRPVRPAPAQRRLSPSRSPQAHAAVHGR